MPRVARYEKPDSLTTEGRGTQLQIIDSVQRCQAVMVEVEQLQIGNVQSIHLERADEIILHINSDQSGEEGVIEGVQGLQPVSGEKEQDQGRAEGWAESGWWP